MQSLLGQEVGRGHAGWHDGTGALTSCHKILRGTAAPWRDIAGRIARFVQGLTYHLSPLPYRIKLLDCYWVLGATVTPVLMRFPKIIDITVVQG